jgi:hypothetical protein
MTPTSCLAAAGADPFGARWTVSLAPSVRTLLECRARATAAGGRPQGLLGVPTAAWRAPGSRRRRWRR